MSIEIETKAIILSFKKQSNHRSLIFQKCAQQFKFDYICIYIVLFLTLDILDIDIRINIKKILVYLRFERQHTNNNNKNIVSIKQRTDFKDIINQDKMEWNNWKRNESV